MWRNAPKRTLVKQAETSVRSAPAALLLAGRRTFKKCGGISADKHATACVTRCSRGACIASTTYVIDPRQIGNESAKWETEK